MSKAHNKIRYRIVKKHRLDYYLEALNALFDGKVTPTYVTERAKKLKEISK